MSKTLKPQDVLVGLKLIAIGEEKWYLAHLAKSLRISVGAAHNAVSHLRSAGLVHEKDGAALVTRGRMVDFLVHGAPAMLYPVMVGITRGIPTSTDGPPLAGKFTRRDDVPTVWPVSNGKVKGVGLEPIYDTVPLAVAEDAKLYDLLTLVDVMRVGRARERKVAEEMLVAAVGDRAEAQKQGSAGAQTTEEEEERV